MKALFLAGGSGTRLWPLSRLKSPKQLHSLVGEKSLITQTIERVTPVIDPGDIWIITNANYADQIAEQSSGVRREQIIAEPFPLGTNLAVGLGLIHIVKNDPDAVVVVGWADSFIGNEAAFHRALKYAGSLAPQVDGVILAVPATYPSIAYGYIEIGEPVPGYEGAFSIARFEEKPNLDRATEFFTSGDHFWNPGISVWKSSRLLELIGEFEPAHYTALQKVAMVIGSSSEATQTEAAFMGLEPIAIDHAIFERATRMAAIPADLEWNDIGSWGSIYNLQANGDSNVIRGRVVTVETEKCLIYSQTRLIATLGVSDLVIVETDDAVLIVHKSDTERLKELYAKVKILGGPEYL